MRATTIEKTGKPVKAGQLAGMVVGFVGVGLFLSTGRPDPGLYLLAGGFAIWISFYLRGWWDHG